MPLNSEEFEATARRRIAEFLDRRGYGSHEAREQDERTLLEAVGVIPPQVESKGDPNPTTVDDEFEGDGPLDPGLDDDLTA